MSTGIVGFLLKFLDIPPKLELFKQEILKHENFTNHISKNHF